MGRIQVALIAVVAFVAGATVLALVHRPPEGAVAPTSGQPAESAGAKILYWFDPMNPDKHFDQPGKSPFMDMQLVPKYASGAGSTREGTVTIDPRLVQNLGVRTAHATLGHLSRTVRATGAVAFDERAVTLVSAPVAAIVERLHVRAPLDAVDVGEPLVTLLAPDWTAGQEEYLALRRARTPGLGSLQAAARQRLLLLGMTDGQVRALDRRGKADPRIVIGAPRSGVIGDLAVREGSSVMPGTPLVRINGLDSVWINAAVPERDAGAIAPGAVVRATVPAFPGQGFEGTVEALLPSLDPATRTITARVVMDNPDRRLTPGMFAQLELLPPDEASERVLVATEAVIATGMRDVVIVAMGEGRFRAQEVRIGTTDGARTEILEGIANGESVVLSGQFLIDSEASLSGALARLGAADPSTPSPSAAVPRPGRHEAGGKVVRIAGRELTIATGPIPSLQMGAMTMTFVAPAMKSLPSLKAGDASRFTFFTNADGEFEIDEILYINGARP